MLTQNQLYFTPMVVAHEAGQPLISYFDITTGSKPLVIHGGEVGLVFWESQVLPASGRESFLTRQAVVVTKQRLCKAEA